MAKAPAMHAGGRPGEADARPAVATGMRNAQQLRGYRYVSRACVRTNSRGTFYSYYIHVYM